MFPSTISKLSAQISTNVSSLKKISHTVLLYYLNEIYPSTIPNYISAILANMFKG